MAREDLRKLSDQHIHFCECYLMHFNAYRAGLEAGFSNESARAYSSTLLQDPLIKKHLRKRTAEIMSEIKEEQLKVFRELMNLATSDIRALYNEDGSLKHLDEWPDDISKCVSSVKHKVFTRKDGQSEKSLEVKLWNKNQALENLARVVGLLTSDLTVNLPDNVGAIYFPAPKPEGQPVDAAVIAQDKKIHLLPEPKD